MRNLAMTTSLLEASRAKLAAARRHDDSSSSSRSNGSKSTSKPHQAGSELYSLPLPLQRLALSAAKLASELQAEPATAAVQLDDGGDDDGDGVGHKSNVKLLASSSCGDGTCYPADGGEMALASIRTELWQLYQDLRTQLPPDESSILTD